MIRYRRLLILACSATAIACRSDDPVQPHATASGIADPSIPTFLSFSPAVIDIDPGVSVQLSLTARNQKEELMDISGLVRYSSADPTIATVTSDGLVTGIRPGEVTIAATVTGSGYQRRSSMPAYVHDTISSNDVVFTATTNGWEPSLADVAPGGLVHWRNSAVKPIDASASRIYLLKADFSVVDSVNLTDESPARRFNTRGVFRFCSGICWDPTDFGTILVH